jgi:hypothetical protein
MHSARKATFRFLKKYKKIKTQMLFMQGATEAVPFVSNGVF